MFLEIVLAFGLFLPAATSQVRAGAVGVGEVCLLLWLIAASIKAMLGPSLLITPPLYRMMIFWGLFFVGMTTGVLTSALLADPHDTALMMHDAIAYCLVALISSLGLLGPNVTFQSNRLHRVLVWTGGLTMLLILMTGLTEIWFYERFRGLSENPNQLAWSSLCLVLLSVRLSDQASTVFERLGAILTATLAMVAGLLTKSNSFNVALAVAGPVFVFLKLWFLIWTPSDRLTIRAAFVWAMICVAPPTLVIGFHLSYTGIINVEQIRARHEGAGETERVRLELWKQALTRAFESYLLGFDPGPHVEPPSAFIDQWKAEGTHPRETLVPSHPDAKAGIPNFEAHNSYLELFYQGGLLVLTATIWLIGDALVSSLKAQECALTALLLAVLVFAITSQYPPPASFMVLDSIVPGHHPRQTASFLCEYGVLRMCGISGLLLGPHTQRKYMLFVEKMAEAIRHRGPNGAGVWMDRDAGIALAHRRLAIVDLSQAGHQPMMSHDGNLVLIYNGEIYNVQEISTDLRAAGYRFRGTSDTEIMLAAFERYGVEAALNRFVGMFALALWDRRTRTLHFARDKIGKKPLFIASTGRALLFGSELKSILAHPLFDASINTAAASAMLAQGWIPEDSCIFENVIKMAPGGLLSVKENDVSNGIAHLRSLTQIWWSLSQSAVTNAALIQSTSPGDLDAELEHLLLTSVRERMLADVPVGALLSGGVDSSLVVSLMQAQSTRAVRTFTASFTESDFDEGSDAKKTADFLSTDHTELKVTSRDALDVVPTLPQVWDEPFADESQIPTLLLSRLVSKHVTVALSGDGGDESFGGYFRYKTTNHFNLLFSMPAAVRGLAASILELLSPACTELALASIKSTKTIRYGDLRKLASAIKAAEESEFYDRLVSYCADVSPCRYRPHVNIDSVPPLSDPLSRLILRDMKAYLPSDILVKIDRASMAAGLETRCPLLDQRVIEFAWRIPTHEKLHHGENKRILRRILARYLPDELIKKPKKGFDVPIAAWLAGPLRDWANSFLDPKSLKGDNILDETAVALLWRRFQHGRTDLAYQIWAILMFQAWRASVFAPSPERELGAIIVDSNSVAPDAIAPRLLGY